MVASFLRSEWHKIGTVRFADKRLASNPDLQEPTQNSLRAVLLWSFRGPLLNEIPSDTQWFAVEFLRNQHLKQLRAIDYGEWSSSKDMNELEKVALRNPERLQSASITEWEPVLWGHDTSGPFTILEGNHRLTALAALPVRPTCKMLAYVGLSQSKCIWHRADR
jgi:hypothetical protein